MQSAKKDCVARCASVGCKMQRMIGYCKDEKGSASPPLVYQSTTSLGLGQVQMPGPKVVVATGAAARGIKMA